jgi:hypothetical protein
MLLALHLLLKSADVSLPSLLEAAATRGSSGRVVCCKVAVVRTLAAGGAAGAGAGGRD